MLKEATSVVVAAALLLTMLSGVSAEMAAPTVDFSEMPTGQGDWVFIAAALHDPLDYLNDPDYQEALALHDYFAGLGFDEEHIILLVDFDTTNPVIDGEVTKGNIMAALDFLAAVSTEDSFVFCGILDLGHEGGEGYYVELNDEPLYDHELDAKLDAIDCDDLVINLVFRYSGGFLPEIGQWGRLCIASCKNNIDVDTDFRLSVALTDPNADWNGNGRISFEEAFWDQWSWANWEYNPTCKDRIWGSVYAPGA